MNNVPLIVGGGDYPRKKIKKRFKRKPGDIKKMPRQPEKMPFYPATGSNKLPNAMPKENLKNALIKVWQDRNPSNQGTKLNP